MEVTDIKMEVENDANVVTKEDPIEEVKEAAEGEASENSSHVCDQEKIGEVCLAMVKLKALVLDLINYFPVYMPRSEEKKLLGLPFQDKRELDENDITEFKTELEKKMFGSNLENFGIAYKEFSLENPEEMEKLLTKVCALNDKLAPYVDHVKRKVERNKSEDRKSNKREKSAEGKARKGRDPQTRDTTKYPIKGLTDKEVSPIRGEFDMMKTLKSVGEAKETGPGTRLSRKELDNKKRMEEKDKSPIREGFNMRSLIRREEFDREKSVGSNEKLDPLENAIERLRANIQAGIAKDKNFDLTKDYEFFMGLFNAEAKKWNMAEKIDHIKNFDVSEFVATKFSTDTMDKIEERVKRVNKYNSTIESDYDIQHSNDLWKGDASKDDARRKSALRNRAGEGDLLDEVQRLKNQSRGRRSTSRSRRSRRRSWSRGRSRSRGGRSRSRGLRSRSRGLRSRSRGRRSRSRGRRSRSRGHVMPFADVPPGGAMGGVGGFNMGVLNGMPATTAGGMPNIAGNLGSILLMQEIQKLGVNFGVNMSGPQLKQLGSNMGGDQNALGGLQTYIAGLQNLVAKQQNNMAGQQQNMGAQNNYGANQQNMAGGQHNFMEGAFQTNMRSGGMEKNVGGMHANVNTGAGSLRNEMGRAGYEGDRWQSMGQQNKADRPRGMGERESVTSRQGSLLDAPYMDRTGGRASNDGVIFGERIPNDRMRSETKFGPGFSQGSQMPGSDIRGEQRFSGSDLRGGARFSSASDLRGEARFSSNSITPDLGTRRGEARLGSEFSSRNSPRNSESSLRFGSNFVEGSSRSGADMRSGSDYGAAQSRNWPAANSAQGLSGVSSNYKSDRSRQSGLEEQQKGRNWKEFASDPSSSRINNPSGYQNDQKGPPHRRY